MSKDDMQRNVETVKRLQQFIETISATFRLMAADLDRLLQDLAQPLHEIARDEEEQRMASWAHLPSRVVQKRKRRRKVRAVVRSAVTGKRR